MNIEIDMSDKIALERAIAKLELLSLGEGIHHLYNSKEIGLGIKIPGWKYPLIVKNDGTVAFDTYNGQWGKEEDILKIKARYGAEKAKIEIKKKGYMFRETVDEQGQIILKITMGAK